MRILYGVQGTGNGHITRARAMAAALKNRPVEVDYLFSGRAPERLFDMEIFDDFRVCSGLTFVTRNGKIRPLSTVLYNRPLRFLTDIRNLDVKKYDLILTDFEPVTAWAGRLRDCRVVGLGHQYAFHHAIPQHHGSISQRLIIRHFAPADISLGLHWHHFDKPILPPIAPVAHSGGKINRHRIIVYLPFESPADIRRLLMPFSDHHFRIYHPEVAAREEAHLSWHPPGRQTFQDDLLASEGVLCNAGFELASEVLQLGKKLLVKPVLGQSEQYSNALAIDLLGYGHVMYHLDREKIGEWLGASATTRIRYPDVAAAICDWLLAGARKDDIPALSADLWERSVLPDITPATRTDNELTFSPEPAPEGDTAKPRAPAQGKTTVHR